MRRFWIMTLIVIIVGVMMVGGATLAYFTDTASNENNTFTAGTLKLDSWRDNYDTVYGPMFYTTEAEGVTDIGEKGLYPTGPWAPGDSLMRVLQVENVGTLDGWLTSAWATLEDGGRGFADILEVKITTDEAGNNIIASGTLGEFIDKKQKFTSPVEICAGTFDPIWGYNYDGDVKDLFFWVSMPAAAGNKYQNANLKAAFNVDAVQKDNNPNP